MIFQIVNTVVYLLTSGMAGWAWQRLQSGERLLCIGVWLATLADLGGHLLHNHQFWLRIELNAYFVINLAVWLTYFRVKKLLNQQQVVLIFSLVMLSFVGEWWFEGKFTLLKKAYLLVPLIVLIGSTNLVAKIVVYYTGNLFTNFLFVFLLANIINSAFEMLNNSLAWWFFLPRSIKTSVHMIYCWINDFTYLLMAYSFVCLQWNKKYFK